MKWESRGGLSYERFLVYSDLARIQCKCREKAYSRGSRNALRAIALVPPNPPGAQANRRRPKSNPFGPFPKGRLKMQVTGIMLLNDKSALLR
jgi:hypothetical protein